MVWEFSHPYHDEKSLSTFSVHELARVLYGECVAVEVDAWFHYMQRYIPTKHPWFYISRYYAKMVSDRDILAVLNKYPYLSTDSANSMSWLFIPLVGEDHFVLLAADVHHVKLMMFNSLPDARNSKYEEMHHAVIKWVRQFLFWRMGNFKWKTVKIEWQRGIPKQYCSNDSGIFVLRYAYSAICGLEMNFRGCFEGSCHSVLQDVDGLGE